MIVGRTSRPGMLAVPSDTVSTPIACAVLRPAGTVFCDRLLAWSILGTNPGAAISTEGDA
ncbi:MAG: hypothetical protein Kow00122_06730 [Thermoleophilia bacterium]